MRHLIYTLPSCILYSHKCIYYNIYRWLPCQRKHMFFLYKYYEQPIYNYYGTIVHCSPWGASPVWARSPMFTLKLPWSFVVTWPAGRPGIKFSIPHNYQFVCRSRQVRAGERPRRLFWIFVFLFFVILHQ